MHPRTAMTSAKTPEDSVYDVAIVGGGPAGLSAALWLGRYLHSVVVIDSGDPRNWETRGVNGFLTAQGIKSPELRKRGREDAERFGAKLVAAVVEKVDNVNSERFVLTLQSGDKISSRRILLAIGIKDVWPRIPGLADCYGETVHVCPDCDGYDTRGCKTIVVGAGRKAVGMAFSIANWTSEIVICTNGEDANIEQKHLDKLKTLNIPVIETKIEKVSSENREIRCITLEGGMQLDCDRLFFAIGQYPADDLGAELKCERDEGGLIVIDDHYHTSVLNVFAAGDIVPGPQLAIAAASDGAIAAGAIHASLVPEARKLD